VGKDESINILVAIEYHLEKNINLNPFLSPHGKIDSMWIKLLNKI
jgi:hypothetical protein